MKVKTILGVVIAVALVLSLSLPAIAGKPTPEVTVGSITYSVNYDGIGNHQVLASNISWQHAHPYEIMVYVQRISPMPPLSNAGTDYAPKGKAGKYPQGAIADMVVNPSAFNTGDQIKVEVRLINRKNAYIAWTGYVTTITWGTNSTWTAS